MKRFALYIVSMGLLLSGCRQKMADQPRFEPYEATTLFRDSLAMRLPVEGTVARGHVQTGPARHEAESGDDPLSAPSTYPIGITEDVLKRGRGRFEIYCAPCHGAAGYGDGIVVKRGLRAPPSFHTDRLRAMPPDHFVEVITEGYGAMFSYAARVAPDDRWAIAAYVKTLQWAQRAPAAAAPVDSLSLLESRE